MLQVSYEPDGTMGLYDYLDKNDSVLAWIPEEEVGNFEYLLYTIKQYLCSKKYKNLLKITPNEFANGDGSSHEGWEIGCFSEQNRDYRWGKAIYIKPFWTYYSK